MKSSGATSSANGRGAERRNSWLTLYLVAGVASVVYVLLSIGALVLDYIAPPPVHGGTETLEFIARHKPVYVAEQILWILPNILPVIVFVTLFVALKPVNKSLALLATVVGALPWALFLAIPVTTRGSLTLVYLSDRYVGAASEDKRRRFATAAEAIIAENNTPAIVGALSALGILLVSVVMLRSAFPRALAWLGVATGALGVVSEVLRQAVPGFYLGYGVLLWAWFTAAGIALIRLGLRTPRGEKA